MARYSRVNGDPPSELVKAFRLTDEALAKGQELVAELASIRGGVVMALYERGFTYKQLAPVLGVSAARIGQIVQDARSRLGEVVRP